MEDFKISTDKEKSTFWNYYCHTGHKEFQFIRWASTEAPYDVYIYSGNTLCTVEIKVRDKSVNEFSEGFLEFAKVGATYVTLKKEKRIKHALYFAFYNDTPTPQIWNIKDSCGCGAENLPKTTDKNSRYNNKYEITSVFYYKIK